MEGCVLLKVLVALVLATAGTALNWQDNVRPKMNIKLGKVPLIISEL